MENWYKVVCKQCHRGAGAQETQTLYYWAGNAMDVLTKYQKTGNVPRDKLPNVLTPLNAKQSEVLENFIVNKLELDLETAKKDKIRVLNGNTPV